MPSEKNNILEFNQYMKLDKIPYISYADIESLMKIIDEYSNNTENSSTTKIGENIPAGQSMSTIWAFNNIENKHNLYRGEECMKKFCESLSTIWAFNNIERYLRLSILDLSKTVMYKILV